MNLNESQVLGGGEEVFMFSACPCGPPTPRDTSLAGIQGKAAESNKEKLVSSGPRTQRTCGGKRMRIGRLGGPGTS